MTIKVNWSAYSVRKVGIKNDFCTSMTCDEYGHMRPLRLSTLLPT